MGCGASSVRVKNSDSLVCRQLNEFSQDQITPLSYRLLISNFDSIIECEDYPKLTIEKQIKILDDAGVITISEGRSLIQTIVENEGDHNQTQEHILQLLPHMILETTDPVKKIKVFLPASLDEPLFKKLLDRKYTAVWGKFKMNQSAIKWTDSQITEERNEFLSSEKQASVLHVLHNPDVTSVLNCSSTQRIIDQNISTECTPFQKPPSRPFSWKPDIFEAVVAGDKSSVQYDLYCCPLLLNVQDDTGNTLVHCAVQKNHKAIIKLLHTVGADFLIENNEGSLPLHYITEKTVLLLLHEYGIEINPRNKKGESLLDIRTKVWDSKMISTLFEIGVNIFEPNPAGTYWMQEAIHMEYYSPMSFEDFDKFVRSSLSKNKTADWSKDAIYNEIIKRPLKNHVAQDREDMIISIRDQKMDRIKMLLALGASGDAQFSDGKTGISIAAENGYTELAKILGSNYCNPNHVNPKGENTFWLAAINGHFDTALVLRDIGADMNKISNDGITILHYAYQNQKNELFTFLLDAGASPNIKNSNGLTVLFMAFLNKDDKTGELLQNQYKGDINITDGENNTLLHLAANDNDLERVTYLLDRGITAETKNIIGQTAFHSSFLHQASFDISTILLNNGANINTQDNNGNTPLHDIFIQKLVNDENFNFLINHEANINLVNHKGGYPISYAIGDYPTFAEKLLENGTSFISNGEDEPLAVTLKLNNGEWFHKLLDHGANGANGQYPILEQFIRSDFYDFSTYKMIPDKNYSIGFPLHAALETNHQDCVNEIWSNDCKSNQVALSSTQDSHHRIPISIAIIQKSEFAQTLINESFDLSTPDEDGMTPLMYACKNTFLAENVFSCLKSKNEMETINLCDKEQNSALTYAANNNLQGLCDNMFEGNCDVDNCNLDQNGIIQNYRDLVSRSKMFFDTTKKHFDDSNAYFNYIKQSLDNYHNTERSLTEEISGLQKRVSALKNAPNGELPKEEMTKGKDNVSIQDRINTLESNIRDAETRLSSIRQFIPEYENKLNDARNILNIYEQKFNQINHYQQRKDMLHHMNEIEKCAREDVPIPTFKDSNEIFNKVTSVLKK